MATALVSSITHAYAATRISLYKRWKDYRFVRWRSGDARPSLRVLNRGELVSQSVEQFVENTRCFSKVHVDLGTGDGKFIYRQAKQFPQIYFVGVDLHPETMSYFSWKMSRKPSRGGGIYNATFLCSALGDLPSSLTQFANSISVNYPWGSLLSDLVIPTSSALMKISNLAKQEGSLEILLNYAVFQNSTYAKSLKLPSMDEAYIRSHLYPTYRSHGIRLTSHEVQSTAGNKSSWGQKLTLGGQREVLRILGTIKK